MSISKGRFKCCESKERRKILYDLNNIKDIGRASLPPLAQKASGLSSQKDKIGSHTNPNVNGMVSQPEGNVKNDNTSRRRKFVPKGRVEISEGATSIPITITYRNLSLTF